MTHASTGQPEALRLADALRGGQYSLYQERAATEAELRRLHARVQELEFRRDIASACFRNISTASQAQRALAAAPSKPLTDAQIKEGRNAVNDDPDDRPEPWAFREGVKFAERMHGITQEKQG